MTLQKNKRVDYLIMCIGNVDGGDDAIGPYIAETVSYTHLRAHET